MPVRRKENEEMVKATVNKKAIFLSLVVTILFLSAAGMGIAADEPVVDKAAKAAEEKEAKERTLAQEKMRKLVQAAKEKLNNTAWQIDLRESVSAANDQKSVKGKKAPAALEKDTINFRANRVESSSLTSSGFTPTNYTVRLKGKNNDIIIWETMQTSAGNGVAFWRGEIDDKDVMRGVLSWQLDEKNKRDYSFVSSEKGVPAPAAAAAPVAEKAKVAVAADLTQVATPAEEIAAEVEEPKQAEPQAAAKEVTPKKKGFGW